MSIKYIIYGRVQGVAFRAFTKRKADELGINGWVQNLADGSVECLIAENQSKQDEFEAFLQQGPSWAKVDKMVKATTRISVERPGFNIIY